jgi:hypothetical protein
VGGGLGRSDRGASARLNLPRRQPVDADPADPDAPAAGRGLTCSIWQTDAKSANIPCRTSSRRVPWTRLRRCPRPMTRRSHE